MATRRITGTAKVKDDTTWIYAGHTLKILERRDPSRFESESEYGAQYKLCLKGTEFEARYPTSPYTFIYAKDLELHEDEMQLDDLLQDTVIERLKKDVDAGDLTAIHQLIKNIPTRNLIAYLPEEKHELFGDLVK